MKLDPAGFPFVAGSAGLAVLVGMFVSPWLAVPFVVLCGFFAFFFRDPHREVPSGAGLVVSPADGRVMIVGPARSDAAPEGTWQQISIFLSPMNVHVNRVPVAGRVTKVSYIPGRFLPAYKPEAGGENERSEIWIDTGRQMVVARQIVGILARRVVCRLQSGADVQAGDRYGVMKFGSRMDIFLPTDASVRVKEGEMVRGGESVIAVLH